MMASNTPNLHLHNPGFRFRETEIKRILAQWQSGESVLLTGIRRTGKSELMKAALYRYQREGHPVAYLDVQAEDKLPHFYQNLLQAILDNLTPTLRDQFGKAFEATLRVPNDLMNWVRQQTNEVKILGVADIKLNSVQVWWRATRGLA